MSVAYSANRIDEQCLQNVGTKTRRKERDVEERIILEWILKK